MNITGRPVTQKPGKVRPRPDYLAAIHDLPCAVCEAYGLPQRSETQAHHVICGRGGQKKTPDTSAIPLCEGHHTGYLDATQVAIHGERERWVNLFGPDTDYISGTRAKLAHLLEGKE